MQEGKIAAYVPEIEMCQLHAAQAVSSRGGSHIAHIADALLQYHHVKKAGRQLAAALDKWQINQYVDQVPTGPMPAWRADHATGIGWHGGYLVLGDQG